MNKRKALIVGIILVVVILMAIGYATIQSTELNIETTAKASANQENFKVYFTGNVTKKSDVTEGNITVDVTEGAVEATVSFNDGLKLDTINESAYVILEIENGSEGIIAESVNVKTAGIDTNFFNFDAEMCDSTGTPISNYEVAVGGKTYVKVSVTMVQTPTDSTIDYNATTTIQLTATPKGNV